MSKRGLILTLGIVLVLLLASPFVIGKWTESRVRAQIETSYTNPMIATRIASYDVGWLNSRARLEIGLSETYLGQIEAVLPDPGMVQMMQSFNIPVIVEFTHGPILLGEFSGIGLMGVKAYPDPESQPIQLAQAFLGIPYLFELHGTSGFGSGFRFTGDVPPIEGAIADVRYDFSGIEDTGVARRGHVEY